MENVSVSRSSAAPTIRVTVRCKKCNQRLFDKVTPTAGFIDLKCPRCGRLNHCNLSLRRTTTLRFRLATTMASYGLVTPDEPQTLEQEETTAPQISM